VSGEEARAQARPGPAAPGIQSPVVNGMNTIPKLILVSYQHVFQLEFLGNF
jgi:hypothetical protein